MDIMSKIEYLVPISTDEKEIKMVLKILNGDRSKFIIKNFVIAKDKNRIIGCIRIKNLEKDTLELSSLVVLSEYQHKGIGSELVRHLLAKEQKRPIFLLTSSDKEHFYNKFNFHLINPIQLPKEFKKEYSRVVSLPFAKNIQVIAMSINF